MSARPIETLEPRQLFSTLPYVSVTDVTIVGGNTGSESAAVVVALSARSKKTVSVNFSTADGSSALGPGYAAVAALDYAAVSGKLTFAPGETSKTILVPIKGDRLPEMDQTLLVRLKGATNARIGNAAGVVLIADNEPRLTVSSAGGAYEGNAGTTPLAFNVDLAMAYDQPVTVNYATSDYGATAGEDYLATSGRLTFAPGETHKEVVVALVGDTTIEADEGFFLTLSGASTNVLATDTQSAYAVVLDDDAVYDYTGGDTGSDPWSYWPGYYWY